MKNRFQPRMLLVLGALVLASALVNSLGRASHAAPGTGEDSLRESGAVVLYRVFGFVRLPILFPRFSNQP